MRCRWIVSLSLVLLMFGCAAHPDAGASPSAVGAEAPVPKDLQESVARAEAIGRALYLLDQAAWIATDVLAGQVGGLEHANTNGYLPFREGDSHGHLRDSHLVVFFSKDDPTRLSYQVRVFLGSKRQPEFESFDPPKPAMQGLAFLYAARQAALRALPAIEQPLNSIILPAEIANEKGQLVYFLAATDKPNVAVLGRHYRVLVSEDGSTVESVQPLSYSLIEIPFDQDSLTKGLVVSHLVTEWPLETHVFASLMYQLPIMVVTSRGDWLVDSGGIRFLRSRSN